MRTKLFCFLFFFSTFFIFWSRSDIICKFFNSLLPFFACNKLFCPNSGNGLFSYTAFESLVLERSIYRLRRLKKMRVTSRRSSSVSHSTANDEAESRSEKKDEILSSFINRLAKYVLYIINVHCSKL